MIELKKFNEAVEKAQSSENMQKFVKKAREKFDIKQDEIIEKKGCGKKFLWISSLKDYRICGLMEDLKHSDHIILCPECRARKQGAKEERERIKKEIDRWYWEYFYSSCDCKECKKESERCLEELNQRIGK